MSETPTILELAYDLLRSNGPLTPAELALAARQLGFQVSGWELQAEIEEHMLAQGESSPFILLGYDQYGLWEDQDWMDEAQFNTLPAPALNFQAAAVGPSLPASLQPPKSPQPPPELIFPAAVGAAITLALLLVILTGGLRVTVKPSLNTLFLPATMAAGDSLELAMPAPAAVEQLESSMPIDLDWWFANPVNQMNADTQAVARQYLSNYYNTCGPAVVAMLGSYLLARGEAGGGPLTTAAVMHDARRQLGYYSPPYNSGLLTFKHLGAMLEQYGFRQSYPQGKGSLIMIEELLDRVRQGEPAIAGMRYSYQGDWQYRPSGGSGLYNHFVIVFAMEQVDGNEYLWVANPHPGKYITGDGDAAPVRMSIDEFWGSWALKDGSANTSYGHAAFYEG